MPEIGNYLDDFMKDKMPEIDLSLFENLSQLTEIKNIWRDGITTLEEAFADLIMRLNAAFSARCKEFDSLKKALMENADWLNDKYALAQEGIGKSQN